jgi:hypothetical protein
LLAFLSEPASLTAVPPPRQAQHIARYGLCLSRLGRFEESWKLLLDAERRLRELAMVQTNMYRETVKLLAVACENTNRADEAVAWRTKLSAIEAATRATTATSQP